MPIAIRRAVPQDAQAIAELIAAAFHEEANPAHIQTLIEEGEHLTFVAEDEIVIGFIDGFYTLGNWDLRRLELDLLAVHPEYSGKGIGKRLIQTFTEAQENAALIRALVAVDNTPMHKAMRATGYKQEGISSSLYIADDHKGLPPRFGSSLLIPVKTFTYTGIWMETTVSEEMIAAAHFLRNDLGYEIVGKVMSDEALDREATLEHRRKNNQPPPPQEYFSRLQNETQLLKDSGFQFIKQFHWWKYFILTGKELWEHIK